jgi:hypothetical protein
VPAKITHPDPPAIDGTVKSPSAALRFIFRHCDVRKEKVHLRRCASSFVIATYEKYASFLKIRAPCIWSFLLCRPFHDFLRDHKLLMASSLDFPPFADGVFLAQVVKDRGLVKDKAF